MRIGIISDSHGRTKVLASALALLKERGVEAVVHCGDVGSCECLELLASLGMPAYAVQGNMDAGLAELATAAINAGVAMETGAVVIPLGDGRTAAVTHGHDAALFHEIIDGGGHAYVFHGHTHAVRDERIGGARVINPGALHHSRHPGRPTVAFLDTGIDWLEWIDVPAR